jgi:hypothetical protein
VTRRVGRLVLAALAAVALLLSGAGSCDAPRGGGGTSDSGGY